MADNYGNDVSRVLSNTNTKFTQVIWQSGKPPLDSELNFIGQINNDNISDVLKNMTPSGFLVDPIGPIDFEFDPLNSNRFKIFPLDAIVAGMPIRVRGCNNSSTDEMNIIKLSSPPTTGNRIDFVFLEVWKSLVSPNPSSDYKPSATTFYKYGNTQYGGTNLSDDLIDNDIGYETTKRVQTQYRLRVVTDVDLSNYPQGLGDPTITGQGNLSNPSAEANTYFINMSSEGDPSCWRASHSSFDTVDGYVYAIPICAVFRRASSDYIPILNGNNPRHNGSKTRSTGLPKLLTQAKLSIAINSTANSLNLGSSLVGSGFDEGNSVGDYIVLGSGLNKEICLISSVNVNTGIVVVSRGQLGTQAKSHIVNTEINLFTARPDGLYADQIVEQDILDLINTIDLNGFDYSKLLQNAVNDLLFNNLQTTWKTSATGSDAQGIIIPQVDVLGTPSTSRPYTEILDAPNGIRTIWSDSAVIEKNVNIIIDPTTALDSNGITTGFFDTGLSSNWTISADLKPTGFMPNVEVSLGVFEQAWTSNSIIFLNLGGSDGVSGARKGFKNNQKAVRFISPWEVEDDNCLKLYFINDKGYTEPFKLIKSPSEAQYSYGLFYPMNVFGGVVHPDLKITGLSTLNTDAKITKIDLSDNRISIDVLKYHYNIELDVSLTNFISGSEKVLQTETIRDLITAYGKDETGYSSELYAIIYGNPDLLVNNGVFQIVGFGNSDLTKNDALTSTSIRVRPLENFNAGGTDYLISSNTTLTLEIRTKRTQAWDGTTSTDPSLCIILNSYKYDPTTDSVINSFDTADINSIYYSQSKLLISATLQYAPGHSGLARTPNNIHSLNLRNKTSSYLRNAISDLDTTQSVYETDLVKYNTTNHIQLWNDLGTHLDPSPDNPSNTMFKYGGKIIGGANVDRNSEVFIDPNSKTLVLRPFKKHTLILQSFLSSITNPTQSEIGGKFFDDTTTIKDGASIFTGNGLPLHYFEFPPMHLPKFGRQDIPYHTNTGTGDPFLSGLNHLFVDSTDNTKDVFNLIGGASNNGSTGVLPMLFYTYTAYGSYNDITVGHPSLGARKVSLEVPSTDFGNILNGIELPPYYGFARVYGVYEKEDYLAKVDPTIPGAHEVDRITPITDPPINLLRTDATQYTMFIRQWGAKDLVELGCNTYILTEHSLDISRIPTYTNSSVFADFDYIIECSVFGFASNFISDNGSILVREYNGVGTQNDNGSTLIELTNVDTVIPSPFSSTDELFVEYDRTVYQGDPYHTKGLSNLNLNDEVIRFGQLDSNNYYYGGITRKQYNTDGSSAITITNPRAYSVLASMDFYLTLGTGNIGGDLIEGSIKDVGYEINHIPPTELNTELKQIKSKAFNEKLIGTANSRAYFVFSKDKIVNSTVLNVIECQVAVYDPITKTTNTDTITITSATTDSDLKSSIRYSIVNMTNNISVIDESNDNVNILLFVFKEKGEIGNECYVSITFTYKTTNPQDNHFYYTLSDIKIEEPIQSVWLGCTKIYLSGGTSLKTNAGNGSLDPALIGLTSRLPLGLLVNDYDFLGEDILNDGSSYLQSTLGSIKTTNISLPISSNGIAYSKVNGVAGDILLMSEAVNDIYTAFTTGTPSGTKTYRTHRGSVLFGISGKVKGSPVSYTVDSFPISVQPVLKGGVLACKAMLVQNFEETAFTTDTLSYGSEIQLVIITQAIYRSDSNQPITLQGSISPSGYGEGYASADRFLIKGRPIAKNKTVEPSLSITPAPYTTQNNSLI